MSKRIVLMGMLCLCFAIISFVGGCNRQNSSEDSSLAGKPPTTMNEDSRSPSAPKASRAGSLGQIRRLVSSADWNGAEGLVQAHLVRHPEDPEALILGAQIYSARGKIDQAVAMIDGAATLSSAETPHLQTQAALLLAQSERWSQAIERLEALLREHPEADEARTALVDILNLRGFRFDANQHTRVLCERQQATVDQLRGLITPSRSHTGFQSKPNPDDEALIDKLGELNVARGLFSEGDVNDASKVLSQSQLVEAKHPAAIAFYGQVLLESQQFDQFEGWLRDVDPSCERYPAYWLALGGWAMRERNYRSAVRMFAEAILREPGDLLAIDRMTQSLAAAGDTQTSERFRQRGVEIDELIQTTADFLQNPGAGLQPVISISQILGQVGRPAESLEWLRLGLEQMGSPPEAMRRHQEGVAEMQKAEFQTSTKSNLLCGLDLEAYPLDSIADGGSVEEVDSLPPSSLANRPPSRRPSFVNVAGEVGLDFRYRNAEVPVERELLMFQQAGGGVACIDYDLDGRVDFYVGQAAGDPPDGLGTHPNFLARNLGDRFRDVTQVADCDDRRYAGGVTAGDWNQDGFLDLVVANLQRNTLFINQGDGTFLIHAGDAVWNEEAYTTSVAMGDVDGDHLPDIVEVNYLADPHIFDPIEHHPDGTPIRLPAPLHFQPAVDRVFLSKGDGSLAGQVLGDPDQPLPATGLGVLITDIDGEVGNEIFIANDHMANHFWEPDVNAASQPRWKNSAAVRGVAYGTSGAPLGCMGIAAADFNSDGRIDLHVTNFEKQWSNHYMQTDAGFFEDLVVASGFAEPTYEMVGFGTQAIDYDNNTVIDLMIGNGHIDDLTARGSKQFEMPTQLFGLNQSKFQLLQVVGDDAYWKMGHLTRALAYCDWNRDGRVDVVTTDLKQPLALLENRTDTVYHWLQLRVVGTRSERDAIGATITASFGDQTVTRVVQAGDGFMCKNEPVLCFGLGEQSSIQRLEIRWPDGSLQTFSNLPGDRRWLIIEGDDEAFEVAP